MNRFACLAAAAVLLGCVSVGLGWAQTPPEDYTHLMAEIPGDVSSTMSLAKADEPGERLTITGKVFMRDGTTPATGVVIYAYQTNAGGMYAKHGHEDRESFAWWHGRLRGFAKTDAEGKYIISTIKPGSYPDSTEPAHIHAMMLQVPNEPQFYPNYIDDFLFEGDPHLTDAYWARHERYGGKRFAPLSLTRDDAGVLHGTRDIVVPNSGVARH